MVGVAGLSRERTETDQGDRRGGVRRRRGVVHQVLLTGDKLFAVVGGREQSSVVDVPEMVEQRVGDATCVCDPRSVTSRFR